MKKFISDILEKLDKTITLLKWKKKYLANS